MNTTTPLLGLILLTLGAGLVVFIAGRGPRPGPDPLDPYTPGSPEETENMRDITTRPTVEAILAAWTYDGPDYFVPSSDWRGRRDRVRGAMPVLARNLDRLVRDWDSRHHYPPIPGGGEGVRIFDHLPPVEAVARSWEDRGRAPGYHRARVREVSRVHPALAHGLNRLKQERKERYENF